MAVPSYQALRPKPREPTCLLSYSPPPTCQQSPLVLLENIPRLQSWSQTTILSAVHCTLLVQCFSTGLILSPKRSGHLSGRCNWEKGALLASSGWKPGCCQTSYGAQDRPLQTRTVQPTRSTALRLKHPASAYSQLSSPE